MAKVPGLTSQTEARPSGGRNTGRVVTNGPGFRAPQLAPTARPVDTFARPQRGPQTNGALQLAESLAQISPGIRQFLLEEGVQRKQQAEDMANRRIGGMSFEEAQKAVKDGSISEMDNPWFKAAFMKQYGERLANQRMNEISQHYETEFDKDGGNIDQYIAEKMKEDLDGLGDNRFFTEAYNQRMGQFAGQANAKQSQYKTERTKDDTQQGVFENFLGLAKNMVEAGAEPSEVANELRSRYAGNKQLLNVDYLSQDREMLRVAQALAEDGQYDVVKALLEHTGNSEDGTPLGAISGNRDFAADSANILTKAERMKFEKTEKGSYEKRMGYFEAAQGGTLDEEELQSWHKANPGALSDAKVESLISGSRRVKEAAQEAQRKESTRIALVEQSMRSNQELEQNDLTAVENGMVPYLEDATVIDESGNAKTIPAETRKKNVSKAIVDRIDEKVAKGELTPEQGFGMEVERFTANGLANPKWQSVLSAGPIASASMTTSGDKVPPALQEGVDLYMKLHAANPRLLQANLKDQKALDYYEAYRIAQQYGRMEPGQALVTAQKLTEDPTGFEQGFFRPRQEEIEKQVRSLASNGFVRFFGAGTPLAKNDGYVANEIARLAQFYGKNGLGTEAALDEAKNRFQSTHAQVNGNWVNTGDRDVPPNFSELATGMLEDYVKNHPKEGLELDDLTIQGASNGSGAWIIVDRTGMPVEDNKSRTFTLNQMGKREQERQTQKQKEIVDQTNADNAVRYDPWVVINENTFVGPWLGRNPTPEEQQRVRERAGEISRSR